MATEFHPSIEATKPRRFTAALESGRIQPPKPLSRRETTTSMALYMIVGDDDNYWALAQLGKHAPARVTPERIRQTRVNTTERIMWETSVLTGQEVAGIHQQLEGLQQEMCAPNIWTPDQLVTLYEQWLTRRDRIQKVIDGSAVLTRLVNEDGKWRDLFLQWA